MSLDVKVEVEEHEDAVLKGYGIFLMVSPHTRKKVSHTQGRYTFFIIQLLYAPQSVSSVSR